MDIDFIMKIAGIGMVVAVTCQILSKVGRDDQALMVSLAGIVVILSILFSEIASLFENVRAVFGI